MRSLLKVVFVPLLVALSTLAAAAESDVLPDELGRCFDLEVDLDDRIVACTLLLEGTQSSQFDDYDADAYFRRGIDWNEKGETDKALEDYNAALRLKPNFHDIRGYRADAWAHKGEWARASADYKVAIQQDPSDVASRVNFGWKLATSDSLSYRNGTMAMRFAKEALKIEDAWDIRSVLAASYAAIGQFEDAIREAELALEAAEEEDKAPAAARLELYKQGKAIYCPGGPECG